MKITIVDLPAIDTTQDVYIKGFIFPTFSEKYLVPLLKFEGIDVTYINLNNVDFEKIDELIDDSSDIYVHLTANKYYSYSLFKKLVNRKILVGGPLPKFRPELFEDQIVIGNELEEEGILEHLGVKRESAWSNESFIPFNPAKNYENKSVENDFSEIVLFNRGCSYNCDFCIHAKYHKSLHRRHIRSIDHELSLYNKNNTKLYIADASIANTKSYQEIFSIMKKYNNISYSMNVRADQISQEFLHNLKEINIDKVYIGVESLDNNKLKLYKKGEKIDQITKSLKLLSENNISYHLSFLISDEMNIDEIEEFIKTYNASSYSFHFYIPYPGTHGVVDSSDWFMNRNWPIEIEKLNKNADLIKDRLCEILEYPKNDYHTITPHNHIETFKLINDKINMFEKIVEKKEVVLM